MNTMTPIPISDQYGPAARDWARTEGYARELEAGRDHWLASRCKALGDMSVAAAEREVKATQEYYDHRMEIERARTAANMARIDMDVLMMRHQEEMRR